MADTTTPDKYADLTGKIDDLDKYVHRAYEKQIDWYWKASGSNKIVIKDTVHGRLFFEQWLLSSRR